MALLVPYESTANLLRAKERPTDETHYPSSPNPSDHTKALTWPAKKRELPPTRKRPAEPTNHPGRTQGDQEKHRKKETQPAASGLMDLKSGLNPRPGAPEVVSCSTELSCVLFQRARLKPRAFAYINPGLQDLKKIQRTPEGLQRGSPQLGFCCT